MINQRVYVPPPPEEYESDDGSDYELNDEEQALVDSTVKSLVHDEIEKPQHYTFTKPAKDCWDVLFESELLTDHLVASAVQYLLRCKKKGMYEKDLKKAATYIKKALEMYAEAERSNNKNQ